MKPVRRTNTAYAMPRFYDSFLMKDLFDRSEVTFSTKTLPAVNILEDKNKFEVEVAVPGLKKENFIIELDNNLLTVSSVQEENKEEASENGKYLKKEFSFHSFKRSFSLPEGLIDEEKISAKYENGVLRLELPKKVEEKPKTKQITVS